MYNNSMSTKKSLTFTDKISYVLLAVALSIFAVAQALFHNPDQDCYFLIDLGRYIVNNRSIPGTAYWLIIQDVPTLIQQWLCDVFNYLAYSAGGYTGILILGIIFNFILLASLFILCRETLGSNQAGLNAAVYCWILLGQYASTRPYSVTISVSLLELTLLIRFFKKDKHTAKETVKFLAGIAAVFVFQANWQASNIPYPMFWILCFIPVIKAKKFHIDLYALAALVTGAVFSMVSPLGYKGLIFLTYARGSFEGLDIYEINPPQFPSLYTVMQLMVVGLLIYSIVKRRLTSPQFFMAFGCFLMSCMFMRCCWTLVLPIGMILGNVDFTERSHKMMRWAYVGVGLLSVLLIMKYNLEKSDDRELMLASVPDPDKVVLYTDFNSGSYFLIDEYKIYFDARPELYDDHIAGDKAFRDEAIAAWNGNIDYDEFIAKYGFNWFALTKDTPIEHYLIGNPDYEMVFFNEKDNIIIYKRCDY